MQMSLFFALKLMKYFYLFFYCAQSFILLLQAAHLFYSENEKKKKSFLIYSFIFLFFKRDLTTQDYIALSQTIDFHGYWVLFDRTIYLDDRCNFVGCKY